MRELICDACGGRLVMGAGRTFPQCDGCGLEYSVEAMRLMVSTSDVGAAGFGETSQIVAVSITPSPLLKRARLMCEDGTFGKAAELVEQALNLDPEDGSAYVVALMARHHCRTEAEIGAIPTSDLASEHNYKMAMRFGDPHLRTRLGTYGAAAGVLASTTGLASFLRLIRWDGRRPLTDGERSMLADLAQRIEEDTQRKQAERRERKRVEARERELRLRAESILARWNPSTSGQGLKWELLRFHESEERVLVTTKGCVAAMPFHTALAGFTDRPIRWKDATLREWLNHDFFHALPASIQARVAITRQSDTETSDRVFLLSTDELNLGGSESAYAEAARLSASLYWETAAFPERAPSIAWWLRADAPNGAPRVTEEGHTYTSEWERTSREDGRWKCTYLAKVSDRLGVRPALWLDLRDLESADADSARVAVAEPVVEAQAETLTPLVARAREFCLDGRFKPNQRYPSSLPDLPRARLDNAESLMKLALDLNPEDADAHVTALMVEHECRRENDLGTLITNSLSAGVSYKEAMRFGSEALKARLGGFDRAARTNLAKLPQRQAAASHLENLLNQMLVEPADTATTIQLNSRRQEIAADRQRLSASLAELKDEAHHVLAKRESLGIFGGRRKKQLQERVALLESRKQHLQAKLGGLDANSRELDLATKAVEDRIRLRSEQAVEWKVVQIDDEGGRALVTAAKSVAKMPFRDDVAWEDVSDVKGNALPGHRQLRADDTTWKGCSLRRYLNGAFYASLPEHIRSRVIEVVNHDQGNRGVPEEEPTTDRVFLLSKAESGSRSNLTGNEIAARNVGHYWLRSHQASSASIVGGMNGIDLATVDQELDVRPYMWVRL